MFPNRVEGNEIVFFLLSYTDLLHHRTCGSAYGGTNFDWQGDVTMAQKRLSLVLKHLETVVVQPKTLCFIYNKSGAPKLGRHFYYVAIRLILYFLRITSLRVHLLIPASRGSGRD